MGTIVAVLGTLASIAATVGLSQLATDLQSKAEKAKDQKAKEAGLSSGEILGILNRMYNSAAEKGNSTVNKLMDALNTTTLPYSYSGYVKDFVTKQRRNIKANLDKATNLNNSMQSEIAAAQNAANAFAYEDTDYKRSGYGQKQYQNLKNIGSAVENQANQINKLMEDIEQHV